MKRRGFLKQSAWLLAATGAVEVGWFPLDRQTTQALAASTPRKLALLVGINRYPSSIGNGLAGCLTDVKLQQQLLIHRFGFASEDVLMLTGEQATRSQLEATLQGDRFQNLAPSDVVVFHFSGYGSQIQVSPDSEVVEPSLVTSEGLDLPLTTLELLLRSLPTKKIVTVLDASYTYPGTPLLGNLRLRSRPSPTVGSLDEEERAFQEQLRGQLRDRQSTNDPGLVFSAAGLHQVATENTWQSFTAGVFSYALTQQLWWASPESKLDVILTKAGQTVETLVGGEQQPQLCTDTLVKCQSPQQPVSFPFAPKLTAVGADGVVLSLDENNGTTQLWLGGLPAAVLDRYGMNSLFQVLPFPEERDRQSVTVQVRSRDGLTAKAQFLDSPKRDFSVIAPGQLVREAVRVLPRSLVLTVALDPKLERIERVDATSAFSGIRYVTSVVAGEQAADCLFGRVRRATIAQTYSTDVIQLPNDRGSYGLFSLGRELIPNSIGEDDEAIKKSVQRLVPQLYALLAAKLLGLTVNETASQLGVQATLTVFDSEKSVELRKQTLQARRAKGLRPVADGGGTLELPAGSRLQYRLQNLGDRPVYYLLFGLDSSGRAVTFYPYETLSEGQPPKLQQPPLMPGETVLLPGGEDNSWQVGRPIGTVTTKLICCDRPFGRTLALLAELDRPARNPHDLSSLSQPLKVAQAILEDLHLASLRNTDEESLPEDVYALDMSVWTTLNFVYRVVA